MRYIIVAAFVLLSGCAVLQPVSDKIASVVDEYCERPVEERLALRNAVNAKTAPNEILVVCDGDE